ncbi:hypothetical protein DL765_000845 [Monosporascus sp. GIB2]|nr:hypothetical protein DL765_000845 [Monosporascus sp. GIB2]
MTAPEVHHLFHRPIADHSFSADRQTLAVAKDSTVELYGRVGNAFKLKDELKGHDKTVTSVDIAPNSGRIVTCSQDRNALVWEPSPTGYKPTLVLLRIARAATFVRWSPSETKFAVGSGDRVIAICYFEEENDWWVSKHLKKPIRSTITTVSWHPNSVLLAAGSTDAHARVFSSFVKGVDARPDPSVWGERLPFNTVCGEFLNSSAGWVHSVAFSPSGDALAFAAHDSSITIVYPTGPEQPPRAVVSVNAQLLPFMSLIWNGEGEIIAAGYDCEAFRFRGDASGWQLSGTLEAKARPGLEDAREESALNMFRSMDLKGKVKDDTQLKTVHQNTISTVRVYESNGDSVSKFSNANSYPPLNAKMEFPDPVHSTTRALVCSQDQRHVGDETPSQQRDTPKIPRCEPRIQCHESVQAPPQSVVTPDPHGRPSEAPSVPASATAQTQTISVYGSSAEQSHRVCTAVRMVHDICLQSTQTYLYTHRANRLARGPMPPASANPPPTAAVGDAHHRSHTTTIEPPPPRDATVQAPARIPDPSDSLLQNVSNICTMLWANSQRSRLEVLNVERLAVEDMGNLLGWAETVALGDYDEWRAGEDAFWCVFETGTKLCTWLGVADGIQAMAMLESDIWGSIYDA